ncbi:MAG: M24 family metallopeptidase [Candidatus Puniceispirillaceae bacterium]
MTAPMNDMIKALRHNLADRGLDGLIIWRGDMFMGEEVRPCDERLARLTGFTGSAGYALVMMTSGTVFSDGRYHLQMDKQLDSRIWQWRDSSQDALQAQLADYETEKQILHLGYDGTTTSLAQARRLPKDAGNAEVKWHCLAENPIDDLWQDRPVAGRNQAYDLTADVTGKSARDKIQDVQSHLAKKGQDGMIITATDCVNWLLNIRGDDLANTPFHLAFAFVPTDGAPRLIEGNSQSYDCISWRDFCRDLPQGRYSMDANTMPMALYEALSRDGLILEEEECPLYLPKACKNDVELSGFARAHEIDGLAMVRFWHWLDNAPDITCLSETDLVERLRHERRKSEQYLCDSFETIMGAAENGAVIHYRAIKGQDRLIEDNNLLLIDSGGHYQTGTTDITRTFAIGTPDAEMTDAYSAVLAAHIALAMSRFPEGTNGAAIDAICRAPLWATGRDYAHGTGHGVGHILSVHEGPAHISKRSGPPLAPGMVLSNEPGYYLTNKWGIRLENLVCVTAFDSGFLGFDSLTLVPFDKRLIDKKALSQEALSWLNRYHHHVYETLSPQITDDGIRRWLAEKCAAL